MRLRQPSRRAQAAPAKTNAPPAASTNAAAAQPAEEEEEPVEALPFGKGNPEALAHFAAGESLEASGQHEQAMEEFYNSVMADPGNEKTARDVAEWLLDQHHPERAVTLLSKVARRPDVSAPILSLLARADLQAGKTNAALAASLQAIARRPDSLQSYEGELEVLGANRKIGAGPQDTRSSGQTYPQHPGRPHRPGQPLCRLPGTAGKREGPRASPRRGPARPRRRHEILRPGPLAAHGRRLRAPGRTEKSRRHLQPAPGRSR